MARRTRNRMELREQYDAAEARERDRQEGDEEGGGEYEAPEEAQAEEADGEEAPKKPKKKAAPKEAKPKRTRTAKVIRQKYVWVVFDNSHKRIQAFPYNQRQSADDLAEKLKS